MMWVGIGILAFVVAVVGAWAIVWGGDKEVPK